MVQSVVYFLYLAFDIDTNVQNSVWAAKSYDPMCTSVCSLIAPPYPYSNRSDALFTYSAIMLSTLSI